MNAPIPSDPIIESVPSDAEVLASIEAFLIEADMRHTRFGREALGEASFVKTLREGRKLSLEIAGKVLRFIADYRAAVADHDDGDTTDDAALSHGNIDQVSTPQVAA